MVAEALVTMDDKKREAMIQQAAEMVMDDVGLIPIHYEVSTWATRRGCKYTPRTDQYTLATGPEARRRPLPGCDPRNPSGGAFPRAVGLRAVRIVLPCSRSSFADSARAFLLVVMSFLVFLGVFAIGNPIELLVNPQADEIERARATAALGLNEPMLDVHVRLTRASLRRPGTPSSSTSRRSS